MQKFLLITFILPLLNPITLIEIMYIYLQSKQHSPTNMRYHNNALKATFQLCSNSLESIRVFLQNIVPDVKRQEVEKDVEFEKA